MDTKNLIARPQDFSDRMLHVGDLDMHLVEEGTPDGPLVVLLHGFPEFWYSWRHQIRALADAGYHVVAPDQRGYNLTSKHGPFDVFTLTGDVKRLVQALGYRKANIIGHDWGGGIAWLFAAFFPDLTDKLIVVNIPHPSAMGEALRTLYIPQILKSMYMGFFQLPLIPEAVLSANNYQYLTDTLKEETHHILSDEEIGYFRVAWSQPGAITGGLNWYRALPRNTGRLSKTDTNVRVPVRLIWGDPDPYLDTKLASMSSQWCPQLDIVYIPGAGHFAEQTAPVKVNQHILSFLAPAIEGG